MLPGPAQVIEKFQQRRDKLVERHRRPMANELVEVFKPGRSNALKESPGACVETPGPPTELGSLRRPDVVIMSLDATERAPRLLVQRIRHV